MFVDGVVQALPQAKHAAPHLLPLPIQLLLGSRL
jgi:hypothetical protein